MNFIPLHKYLVIEKIQEENDFIQAQSQYEKAKVIKVSKEISTIKEGDIIFIPLFAGNVYIEEEKVYFIILLDDVIGKYFQERKV